MEEKKLDRMEGFLKFLNCDMDNLSPLEVYGVCSWLFYVELQMGREDDQALREMKWHLADIHDRGHSDGPRELMAKMIYEVKALQRQFRAFFNDLVKSLEAGASAYREVEGSPTKNWLESITLGTVKTEIELTGIVNPNQQQKDLIQGYDTGDIKIFNLYEENGFPSLTFEVKSKVSRDINGIVFLFLQALEGFRVDQLVQCKNCQAWFVRRDQRKRLYCSRQCSVQDYNRRTGTELKQADPEVREKVLEQARERAHKSYVKKKKAEGHQRNAKIDRRPRKPIREES